MYHWPLAVPAKMNSLTTTSAFEARASPITATVIIADPSFSLTVKFFCLNPMTPAKDESIVWYEWIVKRIEPSQSS